MRSPGSSSLRACFSALWPRAAAVLVLLAASLGPARAGGPLMVTDNGTPFRWDQTQPIRYAVNPGPLGARSHAWALATVKQAFQTWQNVPTAHLQFQAASDLSPRITADTALDFLNSLQPGDPSPILLDSDGSITDSALGDGASEAVAGFGTPDVADAKSGQIQVSFIVVNGFLADQSSDSFVHSVFVHELGHFLGLDHSQLNADLVLDGDPTNDGLSPEMSYRGPNDVGGLHLDDQTWISWLYPNPNFAASTGTIRGRVLLPDGQMTGLQGIEVIARRIGDPRVTAVSATSGLLFNGPQGGNTDPAHLGEFVLPGLPPGSYTVEVQQLTDSPAIAVPTGFLVGGPKFWHDGSVAQDLPTAATPVVVSAGQEVKGIDVVVNGESLGDPKPVAEQEPNELPIPQLLSLPAVIAGEVEAGPGANRSPQEMNGDLHDFYEVTLRDTTTLTALLSATDPKADLDLDLLYLNDGFFEVLAESTLPVTPQALQVRLPAGHYYFGVHLAGAKGSPYTLRLLATPSPDPDTAAPSVWISYLVLGDVTKNNAALHWQTTDNTPSVVYYNQPQLEDGSPSLVREHALPLTGLATHTASQLIAIAPFLPTGVDGIGVPFTTAGTAAVDGDPRIVAVSKAGLIDTDLAEVDVAITNRGDADALKVQIEKVTPAAGWKLLSELYPESPLPSIIPVGTIGAGGTGAFVIRIARLHGNADPAASIHGSYTNAAGTVRKF
jgi:hypothetical protein